LIFDEDDNCLKIRNRIPHIVSTWYITLKDLLLLTYDKQALVLLLVLPLLLISIIGMSTGQFLTTDADIERLKLVIVDQSKDETSKSFIADLTKRPELLITLADEKVKALDTLRRGDAMQVMVIGTKFAERVDAVRMHEIFNMMYEKHPLNGLAALDVGLVTKPNSGVAGELLEAALFALTVKFITPIAASTNAVARKWVRSPEQELAAEKAEKVNASAAVSKPAVSMTLQWVVPGFTVMFAFFLINIMARSFMIERDQGTLRRLLLAPVRTLPLLVGKTIPFYLTSVLQCALLFLCGRILFGMPWGSQPVYLIPVIRCTSASAAALGLLLSTMVRTDQQISSYGTALILVLSALSGCFLPRELFPEMMKQISLFTPHAWSLRAFDEVLNQPHIDAGVVASSCGVLLGFSTLCFAAGWWRFLMTS